MISLAINDIKALLHFGNVKDLVQARIKKVLANGIRRKKVKVNISPALRTFLNNLLDDRHLNPLITAQPSNLRNVAAAISVQNPDFVQTTSSANFILRNIFIDHTYENRDFDKLEFTKSLNIDTCPYCNRNYIYYLSKAKRIKPEIDHFYPTNKYPFFAISYYNLIPSCQTCNGFGAKGQRDPILEDLVNPYLIKNTDFKLSYTINSINVVNPLKDKKSIKIKFIKQLPGHINVFKLQDLYQQHSDHALELIIKSKLKFSQKYREYLKSYKDFKFGDEEIDRLILGNYSLEEEIHKRPLAKLYQDLGRELGLIQT